MVFADEEFEINALQKLEAMSQAMKQLDYHGTVAFFKNGRLDTMKYFHSSIQGQERERLMSLNSPMREVIREMGAVRCVFKKTNKTVLNKHPVSDSFIIDLPKDFPAIQSSYSFVSLDEESVAMLPAYVISIEPKDQYRYKRKVWIDKVSFLPLKTEVYNVLGATVEQVVFTDIFVEKRVIVTDDFAEKMKVETLQSVILSAEKTNVVIGDLPLNYYVKFFTQMDGNNVDNPVEHTLLSDGFSSVSVYVEKNTGDTAEGLQIIGSVKSLTKLIDNHQITVLGEVPVETVQFIAQGIKLKK